VTRGLMTLLVLALTLAGCSAGTEEDLAKQADLLAVVISPDAPPTGMTLSDDGGGREALEQLPLSPETAAQLQATRGFVDGRWSRFAGSESDFQDSRGFVLTWVVAFASVASAKRAASILLNELQSDDHYGWGIGNEAGLGDEGTCLDGKNPQMGGLQETICVWRRAQLVMVVGGGSLNETPVQDDAAAMDARAAEVLP
jgi:hypothetical protein